MSIADNINILRNSTHVEFSAISGYNYYYLPEDQQADMLSFGLHAQSDNMVYLLKTKEGKTLFTQTQIDWYRKFILEPVTTKFFEWPVDLLQCRTENGKYILYYVFSQRAFLDYQPFKKLLYQKKDSPVLDWRKPLIASVCRNFLQAMQLLNDAGFVYHDFNIERMVYQEKTGQVLLRHSMQTRSIDSKVGLDAIDAQQVATEFAPPYIYNEDYDGYLSEKADNFSVAAILFRLMIGRLPYEGRGLSNYGDVFDPIRDRDEISHNNYFQHYHKYPHFIFSEKDEENRLGPMQENDLPRERWEKLPDPLKVMFRSSFSEEVATGKTTKGLYSAKEWLDACNRYCWNTQEFGRENK